MPKHFLSVCAVVRDEAPYIAEWLEFHILQGVEHFYLYENESKDNITAVLKPYQEAGLVTLINYPGTKIQLPAYQHCLDTYGAENEYIAFLDCDEFLHTATGTVRTFLESFDTDEFKHGAIAPAWWHYGSNGHKEMMPGLVIERFTKKNKWPDKHVKSIVRPSSGAFTGKNPHSFRFPEGVYAVDEMGRRLPEEYAIMLGRTASKICINHYHVKSRGEYMKRKQNPDPGSGVIHSRKRLEEMFHAHNLNFCEDTYLRDTFAEQIRENIKKRYA